MFDIAHARDPRVRYTRNGNKLSIKREPHSLDFYAETSVESNVVRGAWVGGGDLNPKIAIASGRTMRNGGTVLIAHERAESARRPAGTFTTTIRRAIVSRAMCNEGLT